MDDLHGTWPKPTPSNIWTVNEIGTRYEHLQRERVLYNDRTKRKIPEGCVAQHGRTNCKLAPTPSVVGSVKQKPGDDADLDMQECRLYRGIIGSLTETISSVLCRDRVSENCVHENLEKAATHVRNLASLLGH